MDLYSILQLARSMELQGMKFYNEQKGNVKLKILKELFSFLSDMEKGHARYLEEQMNNVKEDKNLDRLPENPEEDRYKKIMAKQKLDTANLGSDLGDYSIMRMAYLIEKDFAEFYENSSKESEGETKKLFMTLSEWERGHAAMMKEHMGKILSRNAIDLGFYPF